MKPMLASKWCDKNEDMFPFWAQPKLDGIRVLVADDGYLYTRSLKPVRNIEMQSQIRNLRDKLVGLDAEIIVGDATAEDCYRRTSSAVMSFDNDDIAHATVQVFDLWNHPGDFDSRYGALLERMDDFPDWVHVVPTTLIHDIDMLNEYEARRLAEGHEGVILRRRDALYKKGRGTPTKGELIKLKRFVDMEAQIIAVHEEMHNTNEATINALGYTEHSGHKAGLVGKNTLGAVEVKLDEQKWPSGFVRVGTGFDASQRALLWEQRDELIGKWIKFKYFEVGVKDAPRFPVFLGFRDRDDMEPEQGALF